jgi:hypothetical protein
VNYGYGDEDETLAQHLVTDPDDFFLRDVKGLSPEARRAYMEAWNREDNLDRAQGHGANPTDMQGDSTRKGLEYEREALQPHFDYRDPSHHEAEGDPNLVPEDYYQANLPMEGRDPTLNYPEGKGRGTDGSTRQLREQAEATHDPVLDPEDGTCPDCGNPLTENGACPYCGGDGGDHSGHEGVDEDGFTESDDGDFPLPGWHSLTPEQQAATCEAFGNYLGRQGQGRPPEKTWSHRRGDGSFDLNLDAPGLR